MRILSMNKKILFWGAILLILVITQFWANTQKTALSFTEIPDNFEYDGCSQFPDWDYGDCCKTHDDAYFFWGSWQERLAADNKLFSCVKAKWHWYSSPLAWLMWSGVRIGWAPIFPTSYRWGFGRDRYE